MPTYDYEILDAKGQPTGERFELVQRMSDKPLTKDPHSGRPCRRAIVAPAIAGTFSSLNKTRMSNENLTRLGFTKYERKGKGYMERVAGTQGPRAISAED
jgi:predicted nucleic acid-binding Zn ribbon protein